MAEKNLEMGLTIRFIVIALAIGVILNAVYPHQREIKEKVAEFKTIIKKEYPFLFGSDSRARLSDKSNSKALTVETPSSSNKVSKTSRSGDRSFDNVSQNDKEELDKLINQK